MVVSDNIDVFIKRKFKTIKIEQKCIELKYEQWKSSQTRKLRVKKLYICVLDSRLLGGLFIKF